MLMFIAIFQVHSDFNTLSTSAKTQRFHEMNNFFNGDIFSEFHIQI